MVVISPHRGRQYFTSERLTFAATLFVLALATACAAGDDAATDQDLPPTAAEPATRPSLEEIDHIFFRPERDRFDGDNGYESDLSPRYQQPILGEFATMLSQAHGFP
jgi:hypothetical protein